MQEPTMLRAKGYGIEIQLAVWEGEGGSILCVHGLTANCRCWDVIAAALAPVHRVLAVDLRGRGLSDKPSNGYSEENHRMDLHGVMNDIGLEKVVLMGHSLGGYISLGFAAEHPERVSGLILIDAGGELPQSHWNRVNEAIKPALNRLSVTFASAEAFMDLMKQAPFFKPWSKAIETYFQYDLEATDGGVRSKIHLEHILEEMANKRQTGVSQFYPRIHCPVLILRATKGIISDEDVLLPPNTVKNMLAHIPNARCVDVIGSDHYSILFQHNPERDQEILDFIEACLD